MKLDPTPCPPTPHRLLPWKREPVKNGHPFVAFVPHVGWFFVRRWVWADGQPKPWEVLHRPLRGSEASRDWRGGIMNESLARGLHTPGEALERAEAIYAQLYPLAALISGLSDECQFPR